MVIALFAHRRLKQNSNGRANSDNIKSRPKSLIVSNYSRIQYYKTLKGINARNCKMRADINTMNAALSDVFLANLPKAICKMYEPICMKQPNTVFLHMFDWFITKYGKTMAKDREDNWQRIAADWHPSDGFEPLATRLFIGASYASAARALPDG
jgi:hypothetical protein